MSASQPEPGGGESPFQKLLASFGPRRNIPEARRMDFREMKIAYLGVLLQLGGTLGVWIPAIGNHTKGAVAALVAGCFAAVLLFLSIRSRSRLGTAVAAFLCAILSGASILLAIPFLVLAGWLTMKNSRVVAAERAAQRAKNPPPPRRSRRQKKADQEAEEKAARRPPPSKRYTPPRDDTPAKERRR